MNLHARTLRILVRVFIYLFLLGIWHAQGRQGPPQACRGESRRSPRHLAQALHRAVVGTATVVVTEPGALCFKDGQNVVHTTYGADIFKSLFRSCRNGPGKEVKVEVGSDGVFSNISEGTFKDGRCASKATQRWS
jgi:hypothetical protein